MRLFYWLIAGPLLVVAVLFALSNRQAVDLSIWPLPFEVPVPVFVVALGGLAAGFFAGGVVAWFGAGRTRARARGAERALRNREVEIEDLRRRLKRAEIAEAKQKAVVAAQPVAAPPSADRGDARLPGPSSRPPT